MKEYTDDKTFINSKAFIELLDDRVTLFQIMNLEKKHSNDIEFGGKIRRIVIKMREKYDNT